MQTQSSVLMIYSIWYDDVLILQDISLWVLTFCSDVFFFSSVCSKRHCGSCTGSPCMQSPKWLERSFSTCILFVNSQMVQADSLAILEPVVPVRSLRMPALSFLAHFFSLKIEDKSKSRTSSSSDIAFDVVITKIPQRGIYSIKYLWKRWFISDKKPFSVGSDSICTKLLGNKVDCFKYGAKWNKYRNIILCERKSCMKNTGKRPTFKFISGEERRPSEVQRVSRGWRLPDRRHKLVSGSHLDPKMTGNSGSRAVRAGKRRAWAWELLFRLT